jgi:hypothetical protein
MAPTALMRRVDMPQAVTARSLDWASTLSIIFSPGTVNGGSVDIIAVLLQIPCPEMLEAKYGKIE